MARRRCCSSSRRRSCCSCTRDSLRPCSRRWRSRRTPRPAPCAPGTSRCPSNSSSVHSRRRSHSPKGRWYPCHCMPGGCCTERSGYQWGRSRRCRQWWRRPRPSRRRMPPSTSCCSTRRPSNSPLPRCTRDSRPACSPDPLRRCTLRSAPSAAGRCRRWRSSSPSRTRCRSSRMLDRSRWSRCTCRARKLRHCPSPEQK